MVPTKPSYRHMARRANLISKSNIATRQRVRLRPDPICERCAPMRQAPGYGAALVRHRTMQSPACFSGKRHGYSCGVRRPVPYVPSSSRQGSLRPTLGKARSPHTPHAQTPLHRGRQHLPGRPPPTRTSAPAECFDRNRRWLLRNGDAAPPRPMPWRHRYSQSLL